MSTEEGGRETLEWPATSRLVTDERRRDGEIIFQISAHDSAGYLISGPDYGAHLLSADGRRLRCAPEGHPDAAWQRLLIAQVLPFAAVIHGLEVFHASAVVRRGDAIAFLGPSHTGKTSLAIELSRRGASFLADDVIALEPHEEQLFVHPGAPVAGIDRAAVGQGELIRAQETVIAVNAREQLVQVNCAPGPAPLTALFFLDRRDDAGEALRFEPVLDAQMLLSATFNFVLAAPERLQLLLEVCALASALRVERITIGPSTDTSQLADAVEQRLSSPG